MAVFELHNRFLSVKINSIGAELCSVYSKKHDTEYLWQADKEVWARHAPVLFPVVGKLKSDFFIFNDNEYNLSQHGFARDSDFICIEKNDDSICFELSANENTIKNFPFHFNLQIKYVLKETVLSIHYSVFNPDNYKLFFSIGAHPGFNCPLVPDELFTDYSLHFNNLESLNVSKLQSGLIDDETYSIQLEDGKLNLNASLFENDALVLKNNQVNQVKLISRKSGRGVEMTCDNWPYFGIWTKKQTNHFICLEPWHGIADSVHTDHQLENKEGIVSLNPYETFDCHFSLNFT